MNFNKYKIPEEEYPKQPKKPILKIKHTPEEAKEYNIETAQCHNIKDKIESFKKRFNIK